MSKSRRFQAAALFMVSTGLVASVIGATSAETLVVATSLTQSPVCDKLGSLPELRPAHDLSATDAQVTVHVPAVSWVVVADGEIVAAASNTGCAPRSTDLMFVGVPGQPVTPASDPIMTLVASHQFVGDFREPAVMQPQQP